ncbi:transglutaminase family protein [Corallococcus sp. CA041A]|uniref:transglutaminase family protein n=1 Tax=Corallococcus sp. CA041A TaxID=2316727 RepID=UPI001F410DC6|nr:transglutaminase family protein [Corallococcus sp. CA041A]
MSCGGLVCQGAILVEVLPPEAGGQDTVAPMMAAEFEARSRLRRPPEMPVRVVDVLHRTVYRYAKPVERSSHLLRLTPMHDRLQSLLSHDVTLSVGVTRSEYEDVFGIRVRRAVVDTPYTELVMEARSRVELRDTDPLGYRLLHMRSVLSLVWMPWQANMLQPYLLPPELPDTQVEELLEYAMIFARRNDFDLLDTLLDINYSIFKEYPYAQGTTTLNTTAFSVYSARKGVCQDFANVFICLARLLGVPARYVCGYLYTGPKHANAVMADATHAWVQVYLPEVGWKGFDPTNGILTQTHHVRVAVGRQYSDATPTTGTLYLGGGGEQLEVLVRCEPVSPEGQ